MILLLENEEIMNKITNNSHLADHHAMENRLHWIASLPSISFC